METAESIDERGRYYKVRREGNMEMPIGPPRELVDTLGLPEPFATQLHNALYRRGLINMETIRQNPNSVLGALQEAYGVDASRLTEAMNNLEKEVSHA